MKSIENRDMEQKGEFAEILPDNFGKDSVTFSLILMAVVRTG